MNILNHKLLATALILALSSLNPANARTLEPSPAPAFTHAQADEWINSAPLTLADLRGKVVLIDVWTFGCWNCYRSFPWLNELSGKLAGESFTTLGVHSPEFAHERDREQVILKTKEFGLTGPVMLDNDFSYWKALDNRFWPAWYVLDKQGRLRASFYGETHNGENNAIQIEQTIRQLLEEPV